MMDALKPTIRKPTTTLKECKKISPEERLELSALR
jgi:hypothetical protein